MSDSISDTFNLRVYNNRKSEPYFILSEIINSAGSNSQEIYGESTCLSVHRRDRMINGLSPVTHLVTERNRMPTSI